MLESLQGKKTHIANAVRAIAMLAIYAGYSIDPEVVVNWINEMLAVLVAFEALMWAAVSWFRELGKRD